MENFSYHVPFYVVTNGVATSGHTSDLAGGQIGVFDRQNFSVATASGIGKELFFAQGAVGGIGWYGDKITESHKSPYFMVKDVSNIYKSKAANLQNEEWVLGYDGSASSKSLEYVKGQPTRIKLYFHGEPIYRMFNAPKEYVISYTPPMDCTTDCATDCGGDRQDPKPHAIKQINMINSHVELRKLGVQAKLVEDTYSAGTATRTKYSLSVMDDGSGLALAKVQKAVGSGVTVLRTSRTGITSTYEFNQLTTASAPSAFSYDGASISEAVCGVCPAGWTTVAGKDTYFVRRPIAGTENFATGSAAYATGVGTAYGVKTFDGATAVDPTTNQITITAHGLTVGTPVVYSNGGGTTIVGLTNGNTYYIQSVPNANNVTLSATSGGSQVDITADGVGAAHTLTTAITSSYLGNDGSVATVKMVVPTGVVLTGINGDDLELAGSVGTTCTPPAASTVAWVTGDTCIAGSRTLKIKLKRPDCAPSGDRSADITAALTGIDGVDLTTLTKIAGTACVDEYTVLQNSNDCLTEDCLTSNVSFKFDTKLPAIDGQSWEVLDPTISANNARKVGIRISAGYFDPKFGNCSFDPYDYYETMPIKMEVSLLKEDVSACNYTGLATQFKTKNAKIARQTGEWVLREVIMKTEAYQKHIDQWDADVRTREAFDMQLLNLVDRNAYYSLWYVTYAASYNHTNRSGAKEQFTTVFAIKEGDPAEPAFVSNVIDVIAAKSGVIPHLNS